MPNISAYAFLDDSLDVGTKTAARDHFVMGGYIMTPEQEPLVANALMKLRLEFGLPADTVLHFAKYGHERRVRMAQVVGELPITALAVVLCKRAGTPKRPWGADKLYNWTIKLALERASTFFQKHDLYGSVTIEHMKGNDTRIVRDYVGRLQQIEEGKYIAWDALQLPIRFRTKETDYRLQVADTIASGAGAAFEGFAHSITEQRYFEQYQRLLWRHAGALHGYGLKIHPRLGKEEPTCQQDEGHQWAAQLR